MKRLLLLAILIGSLFSVPNSFAQSSKPKHATIKYENGVKYVGEIRKGSPKKYSEYALINKVFIGKKKSNMARALCILPTEISSTENGIMINVNAEPINLPTEMFSRAKLLRVLFGMEK